MPSSLEEAGPSVAMILVSLYGGMAAERRPGAAGRRSKLALWLALLLALSSRCAAAIVVPPDTTDGVDPPDSALAWSSFAASKRRLARVHRDELAVDYYCGCRFDLDRDGDGIERAECGFAPIHESERSARIEWEHVVPASWFGRHRRCWQTALPGCQRAGRECCQKADPEFRRMAGDPRNLTPVIGALNAARADLAYGEVKGPATGQFGRCDFALRDGVVQPPAARRGDLARISLRFLQRYGSAVQTPENYEDLLQSWDRLDPPDGFEQERARRIAAEF